MDSTWSAFLPEALVTVLALAVLGLDLLGVRPRTSGLLTMYGLIAAFGWLLGLQLGGAEATSAFSGMFLADGVGGLLRLVILGSAAASAALSLVTVGDRPHAGEYYALIGFATLGALLTAGAGDLTMVFLGVELLSISCYVLTAWAKRDARGSEAGLKYLLFGAVSSGVFLYGASLLYGLTGTTSLPGVGAQLVANHVDLANPVLALGALLTVCGLLYKVSATPFHAWTPDVYEGAPAPVTAFLSVTSATAGFGALVRVLTLALPSVHTEWMVLLAVVSVASMTFGNVVAIAQTDVRRMLGYSSIAQGGYVLLGLVVAAEPATAHQGLAAALFYLVSYAVMNLGAFAAAIALEEAEGARRLVDLASLCTRHPWWTLLFTVCLLSLAGLPPFVGFWGKFYLFTAVIQLAGATGHPAWGWLAVVGVLNSVVSLYYYLRIPKLLVLGRARGLVGEAPAAPAPSATPAAPWAGLAAPAVLGALGCLALFVVPGPVWQAALDAVNRL